MINPWGVIHFQLSFIKQFQTNHTCSLICSTRPKREAPYLPQHKKQFRAIGLTECYGPISLINCDMKILAIALAFRLEKYYLNGSDLGQLTDTITISQQSKEPLVTLSPDAEKGFDRIFFMVLERMGFGNQFTTWIKLLYTNSSSRVITNNYIPEAFSLLRNKAVHCLLSLLLFDVSLTCAIWDCEDKRN